MKRSHTNMTAILLAVIFCAVMACVAVYFVNTHSLSAMQLPQLEPEVCVQSGILNDPAGRWEELDAVMQGRMLTFSISTTPVLENGKSNANLLIENPPGNKNRFTVTIRRENTKEEIYESDYLDPRQYIEKAPLDVELRAGEYPCLVYFDAYRIKDNAYIGRTAVKITVFVENWQEESRQRESLEKTEYEGGRENERIRRLGRTWQGKG